MDLKRSTKGPRSRAYRMLLWLFPTHVRRAFGDDMAELFAQQHARVRGVARARLWLRAIADAVRHGLGGRVERARWTLDRRPWTRYSREAASSSSRWWMDTLQHDFRYAVRTMFRQPGLTATILLTLALGIGANTAVFSVVHAVLLRPLPYSEPERLVMVWEQRPRENRDKGPVSPADFLDWARMSTSFTGMAAHTTATADLTGVGDPVQLSTARVAPSFFDVLRIEAMLGRTFAAGEEAFGEHRVVVLSHTLWQQRFGADGKVAGRSIALDGVPHEIIGVLPRDFEFPGERSDIWIPLALRGPPQPPGRANHFLSVYARLKPGVSIDAARAELQQIGSTLAREYPLENEGHGPNVVPLREEVVGPARSGLLVVMSAVAFLLLIACTNVTNLLLARSVGRRREMAIRSAVGAARSRLLRQALTESLLLCAIGGALGLIVASWTVQLLVAETPPLLSGAGLDRARLDIPVLLFTTLLCVVTGLVAGVLPAWQASREEPVDPLREGGRSPAALRRGVRFALIATEVALSVLMLVGAGLMLRSFIRVLSQPPGIETANRLTVNLTLPQSRYPDADARRRARVSLDERLNSIPGVVAAGANNNLPLTGSDSRQGVSVEGLERSESDPPTRAHLRIVTPRYFEAAGIVLRSGRFFSPRDDARAPLVVVINETMARRYWPGQSPIGRRLRFFQDPWREVIGVVGDVKHWGLDREVNPELYMPYDQQPSATLTYVLHTASSPETVVAAVDAHVKAMDRDLPLGAVRTFEEVASKSVATRRWSALLLGMFAILGVVLAGAGIYGVMAHLVSMRTGEIGIRMTLGAHPVRVLRQVLSEALQQASVGLVIGLVAAYATMRAIQSLLFEVRAADPIAFIAASTVVLIVAGLAGIVPAVRAMRVDPVKALRAE